MTSSKTAWCQPVTKRVAMPAKFIAPGAAMMLLLLAACAPTQELAKGDSDGVDAGAPGEKISAEESAAAARVAAEPDAASRIKADVAWLADDARAGREAGSAGYESAARYVAARFAQMGLAPGVDGTQYLQPVSFRSTQRDLDAAAMTITDGGGTRELAHIEDFLIGRNAREASFSVEAPVVFVGFGVRDPRRDYDDYAGVDVSGKIVAFFSGAPDYLQTEERAYFNSTATKLRAAADAGAVGAIFLISQSRSERFPWARMSANPDGASLTWRHPDGSGETAAPDIKASATLSPDAAGLLFDGAPVDFATLAAQADEDKARFSPFETGKTVALTGGSIFSETTSPNVIGLIEGADPVLKDEVIILTAHLDHIGVSPQRDGDTDQTDRINNGAMDNAMGVSSMLEVARRIMAGPAPRRTIAFAAVTAEEKGLLGAGYLAAYPPFGDRRIVANVNLDMPLTLFPFTEVVAFGAERSTIGDAVATAAEAMSVKLVEDPVPQQSLFTRSDHYRFVEQGVPSVFIFLGFEGEDGGVFGQFIREHYHSPSDDINLPIDYDASAVFADLNYRIVDTLAAQEETPAWREGEFFAEQFGGIVVGE